VPPTCLLQLDSANVTRVLTVPVSLLTFLSSKLTFLSSNLPLSLCEAKLSPLFLERSILLHGEILQTLCIGEQAFPVDIPSILSV
jgi:hypothetical protein